MQARGNQLGLVLMLSLIAVSGCSKKKSGAVSSLKYSYDYTVTVNGETCKTNQAKATKEELCEALRDEELNKGCAKNLREQKFYESGCTGEFEQKLQIDLNPTKPEATPQSGQQNPTTPPAGKPVPKIESQEDIEAKYPAPNIDTEDPNPHTIENELRPTPNQQDFDPSATTSTEDQERDDDQGQNDEPGSRSYAVSYKYTQTTNGVKCTTGTRRAYSKEEFCAILLDERLNNNCALPMRQEEFKNSGCENLQ